MKEQVGGNVKDVGKGKKDALVTEITPQSVDFSRWYLDVVLRAELSDYTEVKGCMNCLPWSASKSGTKMKRWIRSTKMNAIAQPTASAITDAISRLRSSSRCSRNDIRDPLSSSGSPSVS